MTRKQLWVTVFMDPERDRAADVRGRQVLIGLERSGLMVQYAEGNEVKLHVPGIAFIDLSNLNAARAAMGHCIDEPGLKSIVDVHFPLLQPEKIRIIAGDDEPGP